MMFIVLVRWLQRYFLRTAKCYIYLLPNIKTGGGVFSMLQINTSVSDGNMFSGDCKRNMSGVWWQGNMVVDRATGTKKTDLSTSLKSLVYLV